VVERSFVSICLDMGGELVGFLPLNDAGEEDDERANGVWMEAGESYTDLAAGDRRKKNTAKTERCGGVMMLGICRPKFDCKGTGEKLERANSGRSRFLKTLADALSRVGEEGAPRLWSGLPWLGGLSRQARDAGRHHDAGPFLPTSSGHPVMESGGRWEPGVSCSDLPKTS